MIALNSAVTIIRRDDGSEYPFDAMRLRDQILEAFFLSGSPQESWLADEMTQGVEFSISQLPRERQAVLAESRLLDLVAQLFAQTGFPAAARTFTELQTPADTDLPGSLPAIFKVLDAHYADWPAEKIRQLAGDVCTVVQNAGILSPTHGLIIELAANLFRRQPSEKRPLPVPSFAIGAGDTRMVLDAIVKALPDPLRTMVESGVIEPLPLSRVFPVLTLRIRFVRYIQTIGVVCPTTELALTPHLPELGCRIIELYDAISRISEFPNPLPLCLEFVECPLFSERVLSVPYPLPGKEICAALVRDITSTVTPRPYKTILL